MKVVVDTDIWIDYFNGFPHAVELIEELAPRLEVVSSILTITELRAGMTEGQAEEKLSKFYKISEVLPVTEKIAELAGAFIKQYSQKGISLPTVDTIIGVTAMESGYELATRNKKDFPMPQVKFYGV